MVTNKELTKHQAKKLYKEDSFNMLFQYIYDEARKDEREEEANRLERLVPYPSETQIKNHIKWLRSGK